MFPITARSGGTFTVIAVLALNAAIYAGFAFVVAWAAHKGWAAA